MAEEYRKDREITLTQAALPVGFLLFLIIYGLIARPILQGLPPFPLEITFILAASFAIGHQLVLARHPVGLGVDEGAVHVPEHRSWSLHRRSLPSGGSCAALRSCGRF